MSFKKWPSLAVLSIVWIGSSYSMDYLSSLFKESKPNPSAVANDPQAIQIPAQLPSPEQIATQMGNLVELPSFLLGASTCEHQCSKLCTPEICSWSRFANGDNPLDANLPQPTDPEYRMNWAKYYEAYIDQAKNVLKLNALRFSVEWPLVQPNGPNSYDQKQLNRYADTFIYMIKQGVTPLVCFHHYTDPNWFLYDKGGFEDRKNIKYFGNYCKKVYEYIMDRVSKDPQAIKAYYALHKREPLWITFNAPDGYAFRGYMQQAGPPAKPEHKGFTALPIVAKVLGNTLRAHTDTYLKIKNAHKKFKNKFNSPKVGFLKNIHQLDPAKDTYAQYAASYITKGLTYFGDYIQNKSVYNYFTTGEYNIPFLGIAEKYPKGKGSTDFVGLNYYANRHMYFTKSVEPKELVDCKDKCSDNEWYYRYPVGMYRAIVAVSHHLARPLGIPVFVAENGIATMDDNKRYKFYHEYLYAIGRAVQDGYQVFGYCPWTLADNYEWPKLRNNTRRNYGLFRVDTFESDKLHLKKGSESYKKFTHTMDSLINKK